VHARFRHLLCPADRVRYAIWRALGARYTFRCRFKNGPRISIRPHPSEDYNTAYDVFRRGIYDLNLEAESVRRVVDLGGNVGYTCILWCWQYPDARVLTFEPNPKHYQILNWHLDVNHYRGRVQAIEAAAASRDDTAVLLDADVWSRVLVGSGAPGERSYEVRRCDFFSFVGQEPIDIFKMDIEGGEYELMTDPRFDAVARKCRTIVMEWHTLEPGHLGGQWCMNRLRALNFEVVEKYPAGNIGLLIAQRSTNRSGDAPPLQESVERR